MENRKSSLLKTCHVVFIFVGVALCAYGCIFDSSTVFDKTALI